MSAHAIPDKSDLPAADRLVTANASRFSNEFPAFDYLRSVTAFTAASYVLLALQVLTEHAHSSCSDVRTINSNHVLRSRIAYAQVFAFFWVLLRRTGGLLRLFSVRIFDDEGAIVGNVHCTQLVAPVTESQTGLDVVVPT